MLGNGERVFFFGKETFTCAFWPVCNDFELISAKRTVCSLNLARLISLAVRQPSPSRRLVDKLTQSPPARLFETQKWLLLDAGSIWNGWLFEQHLQPSLLCGSVQYIQSNGGEQSCIYRCFVIGNSTTTKIICTESDVWSTTLIRNK